MFKRFGIGKKLLLGSAMAVLIFLSINLVSFVTLNSFVKQLDLEKHTVKVLENLDQILIRLIDAETGQRGYILTGEIRYLEPYDRGIALVNSEVDDVRKLTSDNPKQQQKIIELRVLIVDKIKELQETIDLRAQGRLDEAVAVVLSDKGKSIMDNIRGLLDSMKDEENKLLKVRAEQAREAQAITEVLIIFGSLMGFVIVMVTALILTNSIVGRVIKTRDVADEIARGNMDVTVDISGSDEIADLSRAIDTMRQNLKEFLEDIKSRAHQLNIQLQATEDARKATLNILEDVEEEKENVAREKEKIDAILHSIGDGVFVVDKEYRITMFNQIAANISGFSVKEAMGKKYNDILKFVFEKGEKANDQFIKDAMVTGEVQEMSNHTVLVRKDGSKVAVADSAAPLKDTQGNVIGCVVVFRDVAKEREIDKAKTEFVSLASHQLRTPLSTIGWYAEMLLAGDAGKLTKEQRSYMEEVYKGNQRMVDLVNALLNVSRIELGTLAIEPKPTDLRKIADSVLDELEHLSESKNIHVEKRYDRDLPIVNIDEKMMRVAIQNLLSNAIKYTPEKGKVTIELIKKDPDILIKIKDTGYGIPKAQQAKIFTKLFRADNVRAHETEGTGLGLYIVKAIIEQSGGKIWFESEENKGTTFYCTIPLAGMKKKKGTKGIMVEKFEAKPKSV